MMLALKMKFKEVSCFNSFKIDIDLMYKIRNCAFSNEGAGLMAKAGDATNTLINPGSAEREWANLPWVVVNGERSELAELDGQPGYSGGLLQEVCFRIKEPRPVACILGEVDQDHENMEVDNAGADNEDEDVEEPEPFIAEDEKIVED